MLFHTKRKQRIKLRQNDKKEVNKRNLKIFFIIFFSIILLYFCFIFKNYLNKLIINKNLFALKSIKINLLDNNDNIISIANTKNLNFDKKAFLEDIDLNLGDNIKFIDVDIKKKEILKKFKNIEDIDIKKYYPYRIVINIKMRAPVFFLINGFDNKKILIDKNGYYFYENQNFWKNLHLIELDTRTLKSKYKINKRISFLTDLIFDIKNNDNFFYKNIKKIYINENFEVEIFFNDKFVLWGAIDKLKKEDIYIKLKLFHLVIKDFKNINDKKISKDVLEIDMKNLNIYKKDKKFNIDGSLILR
jgi:hypothetical protein